MSDAKFSNVIEPAADGIKPPPMVRREAVPAETVVAAPAKQDSAQKSAKPAAKKTAPRTARQTTKAMEKTMTTQTKNFDKYTQDAAKGGKEHMDAMMTAGNVFMKGFEDIAKTYMGWAQSSAEKNSQAVKALMSCKTMNEFAETQNKWAQQSFDDFMAGATKLSELGVRVATDVFQPINDQVSKNIKKATDSLAA